ncbi:MAG: ABC transporter permease [Thermoplasmatales archaeon]|nr:ABC transporter permease [Thermoplasmatales archaeon]
MRYALAYVKRDLMRWGRAPLNVASSLALPAAWLLFMGLVMPINRPGYMDFILPGILVMTMLGTGLSGGSSMMFDKSLGYLGKFLAAPSPRESILVGKIIFITVRGLAQSTVILMLGLLAGATLQSLTTYLAYYAILALFGVALATFGTTVALHMEIYDNYAAFQAFVTMPLYLASTALVRYDDMPTALYYIAKVNPVSYAIDACRDVSVGVFPAASILVLLALIAVLMPICVRRFRKITVS